MNNHFHNFSRIFILCITLFFVPQLFAQKSITGIVMDGSINEALIGGTVAVKGGTTGTITDINGKFTITVSPNDILVFSYIGLEKQEVVVGDKTIINVTLKPSSVQLTEVVAIGYGVVKKSDLTGSVAVVSAKDLTKNPSASAAQALQGKAPGVVVTQSGKPGGGATIRVRGVGSINNGADPIYILDGVQVSNIESLQPSDIESLQVLKDASAAAIYGANGSNGVIIVTTKRGKSGKVQVNLNSFVGVNLAPKQYDVMNAQQYADFYTSTKYSSYGLGKTYINSKNETVTNPAYAFSPEFRQKYYGTGWEQGINWQDMMFKDGLNQNHNLSIAGGGENSNFSVSFGYMKDDGNVINSNADRYSIRANSDFKLNKYIKIGENVSLAYRSGEQPVMVQSSIWDLNPSPLMKLNNPFYRGGFESPSSAYWEDAAGNLQLGTTGYTGQATYSNTVGNDKPNPYAAPSMSSDKNYNLGANASVYLQIDFADWLMYKVTPSAEIMYGRTKRWMPQFAGNRSSNQASLSETYKEIVNLNLEQQLTFKKKFNDVHNVLATGVYQVRAGMFNDIGGTVNGFDFEQLNTLTNGGTASKSVSGRTADTRMLSYLARVMYDFKGKYFFTGSVRSDGIYSFAPGNKRGTFSAASFAWKINEDFFQDVKQLDALKLRLGWGQTGNSNMGSDLGDGFVTSLNYLNKITDATNFSPVFGDDQHIARAQYVFYGMGSSTIKWETAEMYNFGLDFSFFNSKIQGSAEYYIKNNNDLLIAQTPSSAFGRVDAAPYFNSGNIQNRGVEISLQWKDQIGDFSYGVNTNFTTIKNEVLYLPGNLDVRTAPFFNTTKVGHSIGAIYGYVADGIIQTTDFTGGKDPVTGLYTGYKYATYLTNTPQPGDIRYKDLTGNGNVDALDKTIIGKTIPSFTYTVGFDCAYKGFDFNMFLFGVTDFQIFNQQRANMSTMNSQDMDHNKLNDFAQNYWTEANASTTHVRVDLANKNANDQLSSFWVEDGSFLRIKDIQFGYTLSKKLCTKLGLGSVRVYANASNVYCFTAYKGRDPEGFISGNPLSSGTDYGDYTIPRSFTGGLQIGF